MPLLTENMSKLNIILINISNSTAADETSFLFFVFITCPITCFIMYFISFFHIYSLYRFIDIYRPNRFSKISRFRPSKQSWSARNRASMHLPTRGNERFLRRVRVTYSADAGPDRDQAAGKPMLLSNDLRRHLLRVAAI